MADDERKLEGKLQALSFDVRALLQLAIWGSAAALALMVAVLSAYVTMRPQRAAITVADPAMPVQHAEPQTPAIAAQLAARAAEAEAEMQRLSEVVVALGTDRDRLVARIGTLERNLEDVTGAIHRQATPPSAPPEPAAPLPARAASPTVPPADLPPLPPPRPQGGLQTEASAMAALQPAAAAPPPSDSAATPRIASVPAREAPDAEPAAAGEFGVDVGGATRFDALRALWHSTRSANPALFEGLHPIVSARESKSRGVDLRLVVGPLPSTEAATKLCAALMAARRHCQMTTFDGQPFALSAPEPERRSAAAPLRNPTPAPTANSAQASAGNSTPAAPSTATPAATGNSAKTQARARP